MKKADFLLAAAVILIALACLGARIVTRRDGSRVIVRIDGKETAAYSLHEEQNVEIETPEGTNLLVITGGTASVTDADCPDRLCVHEADIRYGGEVIVCLPHRLVISVEGEEKPETDSIVK